MEIGIQRLGDERDPRQERAQDLHRNAAASFWSPQAWAITATLACSSGGRLCVSGSDPGDLPGVVPGGRSRRCGPDLRAGAETRHRR